MSTKKLGVLFIVLLLETQVNSYWIYQCKKTSKQTCKDLCVETEKPGYVDTYEHASARTDCEVCFSILCRTFVYHDDPDVHTTKDPFYY